MQMYFINLIANVHSLILWSDKNKSLLFLHLWTIKLLLYAATLAKIIKQSHFSAPLKKKKNKTNPGCPLKGLSLINWKQIFRNDLMSTHAIKQQDTAQNELVMQTGWLTVKKRKKKKKKSQTIKTDCWWAFLRMQYLVCS